MGEGLGLASRIRLERVGVLATEMEQQTENRRDDDEQPVPHGALADLFDRAERIRQAYDDLRGTRSESDAQESRQ